MTFIKNEKGRPEAQEGSHDDLIMCTAITYYIRNQQDRKIKTETKIKQEDDFFEFTQEKLSTDYGEDIVVI